MFRRKEETFDFESEEKTSESSGAQASEGASSAPTAESRPHAPGAAAASPQSASAWAPAASAIPAYRSASSGAAPAGRPMTPATRQQQQSVVSSGPQSPARQQGKRILTVGTDILLKGEIATCDRLVIEGEVDAKLKDVHTVEIAETGSFKGGAEIQDAEISGLFEGTLVVRGRLIVYSTGRVIGKSSYGEIEIERGGQLTGEISMVGQGASQKVGKLEAA